jgi:tRNA splicing ligase
MQERKDNHLSLKASDMDEKKLRGILGSFCSKWAMPDEDEESVYSVCSTLDMTAPTQEQVTEVCHALYLAHLLPTEPSPQLISDGLECHAIYEEHCGTVTKKKKPKKKPKVLYWSVDIVDSSAVQAIYIQYQDRMAHLVPLENFHITLAFKPDKKMNDTWQSRSGEAVQIQVLELVWDDQGAALVVREDGLTPHTQQRLHITLALAPGVKPFYSNELLAKRGGTASICFRPPLMLTGVVKPVTR